MTINEVANKYNTLLVEAKDLRGKNEEYKEAFENCPEFIKVITNSGKFKIKIKFLTLKEIIETISAEEQNTAVESSEIARLIQLLKAANMKIN